MTSLTLCVAESASPRPILGVAGFCDAARGDPRFVDIWEKYHLTVGRGGAAVYLSRCYPKIVALCFACEHLQFICQSVWSMMICRSILPGVLWHPMDFRAFAVLFCHDVGRRAGHVVEGCCQRIDCFCLAVVVLFPDLLGRWTLCRRICGCRVAF